MAKPQSRDALLEIRAENLPPALVRPAEEQLERSAAALLAEAGLPFAAVKAFGTCRRLALLVSGVPASVSGRRSVSVLAGVFPEAIASLRFPGAMSWDGSGARFARPVRGVTALFGDAVVPFTFAGLRSGRLTVGLSAGGSRPIRVASAEKYLAALGAACVLADDAARRASLEAQLAQAEKRIKLRVEADPELVRENVYLSEHPVCVVGGFSQEFLDLPHDLARGVIKGRLKFFPVSDAKGRLQPYFIGVRDGVSKGQKNVEEGFRAALEARFRDAAFFRRMGRPQPRERG